ncbi:Clp protease N-terminal domain-containing protein, partial [Acidobacteriota bacterium]
MKTSDTARRVLSYAAYDCAQRGKTLITPDHLLLGLFREDFPLIDELLDHLNMNSLHLLSQILKHNPESLQPIDETDVRFGRETIHVLCLSEQEAQRFSHKAIRSEHLLLGLMGYSKSFLASYMEPRRVMINSIRLFISQKRFGSVTPL